MIKEDKHKFIIGFLEELGKCLNYKSSREFNLGKDRIDVVWECKEGYITFEVEVGNDNEQILKNLNKCLKLKPISHIHIVTKENQLKILKGKSENIILLKEIPKQKFLYQKFDSVEFNRIVRQNKLEKEKIKECWKMFGMSRASYFRYKKLLKIPPKIPKEPK